MNYSPRYMPNCPHCVPRFDFEVEEAVAEEKFLATYLKITINGDQEPYCGYDFERFAQEMPHAIARYDLSTYEGLIVQCDAPGWFFVAIALQLQDFEWLALVEEEDEDKGLAMCLSSKNQPIAEPGETLKFSKVKYEPQPTSSASISARHNDIGLTVIENHIAKRFQLMFDGKLPTSVRSLLRSHGFWYGRSEGAWQRLLTERARQEGIAIVEALKGRSVS